jgi:RNA polymerase sigma factor (TIGR02999 family)
MDPSPAAVASLVDGARQGDEQALATLVPLVYDELRRLAASYLRRERPGQTLQATALVHDAYLRLLQDSKLSWQNRAHFFGIAARSMRQILIERARARHSAKRGGDRVRVTFDPGLIVAAPDSIDFEALDDALTAAGRPGSRTRARRRSAILRWSLDRRNRGGHGVFASDRQAPLDAGQGLARARPWPRGGR